MALKKFNFNVNHTENHSRVGVIETHRGNINTPAFMPVGTQATVKGIYKRYSSNWKRNNTRPTPIT